MLTNQQIRSFKENGVLRLPGFFTAEEVASWREQVVKFYRVPQNYLEWKTAIQDHCSTGFKLKPDPTPKGHAKMRELYRCFHNEIEWTGENELVARRPEFDAEWLGARTPHLDYPLYAPIRTLANSVFYVNDVSPQGGPFMYWKGSHTAAWNYFRHHPADYMAKGDRSQGQVFELLTNQMKTQAVPFYGKAGDLLIWHSLLLHSPAVNRSYEARLAIIGRWGAPLQADEWRFDFSGDMWESWKLQARSEHQLASETA